MTFVVAPFIPWVLGDPAPAEPRPFDAIDLVKYQADLVSRLAITGLRLIHEGIGT
jgi:hypothetical protein